MTPPSLPFPATVGSRPPALPASRLAPRLERAVGTLLGGFLFAQCFGLPVLAAGPWPLWPGVADLLFWAALGCGVLYRMAVQPPQQALWRVLVLLGLCSVFAAALPLVMGDGHLGIALPFGAFALFKVVQLLGVFWIVSRLRLGAALLRYWRRAATAGLVVMGISIVWTFFSPAIPQTLGQLLPHGAGVSGPWESYYLHHEPGLGMVGYNHAHVAATLLVQAALVMMLRPGRRNLWVLGVLIVASFLSGARAGLAGSLLFALLQGARTPLRSALVALVVLGGALLALPSLGGDLGGLISRQSTLLDAADPENLAGRADIWQSYFGALGQDPVRLLVGSGFGSGIANIGSNAHLLPLQVVYETGVVGLILLGGVLTLLVRRLTHTSGDRSRVALHLLAGLALSSLAAEVFYPNTAFGSFLPLMGLTYALALAPNAPRAAQETV